MPPTTHDPSLMLIAMGVLFALVLAVTAVYRLRRRPGVSTDDDARLEADRKAYDDKRKAEEIRARADFNKAVAEGRLLADGRVPCQASPTCGSAAVFAPPSIVRDRGFWNFFRTRFGAVDRYRMVEETAPWWFGIVRLFGGPSTHWQPVKTVQYCEVHMHVARQVCAAQLAHQERDRQEADKRREVQLATFEARGMLAEVQSLVKDSEIQAEPFVEPRSTKGISAMTSFSSPSMNGHAKESVS